jgi:plastocyanin
MGRLRAALLVVVGVLVLCLWGAGPAAAQTTHVVQAVDPNSWSPANISAQTGDTVRWEFDGTAVSHNVRSSSANWTLTSPIQVAGPPVQFTFDTPGTYTFLCEVHGSMTGSVTVADAPADPLEKILVFSETAGFRHDSIPQGIAALQALGTANDFTVDATEDSTAFNDANLAQYDVVVFLSTTGDVLTDEQQAAFERYIQAGNGYVGIHAAADTEYTWPWYGEMLGGYFRNHPPGTPSATVRIEDGDEPSTQGLPTTWPRVDEW